MTALTKAVADKEFAENWAVMQGSTSYSTLLVDNVVRACDWTCHIGFQSVSENNTLFWHRGSGRALEQGPGTTVDTAMALVESNLFEQALILLGFLGGSAFLIHATLGGNSSFIQVLANRTFLSG